MVEEHIESSKARVRIAVQTLGQLVHEKRIGEGISLRKAEQQSGVAFNTIYRIEQCRGAPSLESFKLVLDWLEVPPALVLGGEKPPNEALRREMARYLERSIKSDNQFLNRMRKYYD